MLDYNTLKSNKSMSLKKVFLVIVLLVVAISSAALYIKQSATLSSKTYTVTLTENGFVPQKTTVHLGDTVVFKTTRKEMFWSASDLHPTHGLYPEFDPEEPIDPKKTWSFTFTKIGKWPYHDHLFPYYRGEIEVVEKKAKTDSKNKECKSGDLRCYQNFITSALQNNGIDAAFNVIMKFYQTDPVFAAECHGAVHELGKEAYREFIKHDKLLLSPKASFCAYGFYHGFMDELLLTNGDVTRAQEFCDRAGRELQRVTLDAGGACYHGIGHGVTDKHIPSVMGSFNAIIEPNLKICEKIAKTPANLYRCATGVFNAAEILTSTKKYGLRINESDPFEVCRSQKRSYQDDCYPQFVPPLLRIVRNDFYKASSYVESIIDNELADTTMVALVNEIARVKGAKVNIIKDYISLCWTVQSRLHVPCITALSEGLMKYGPPENEYKEALVFCRLPELLEEERVSCYQRIGSILQLWYSRSKTKTICESFPSEYLKYCLY